MVLLHEHERRLGLVIRLGAGPCSYIFIDIGEPCVSHQQIPSATATRFRWIVSASPSPLPLPPLALPSLPILDPPAAEQSEVRVVARLGAGLAPAGDPAERRKGPWGLLVGEAPAAGRFLEHSALDRVDLAGNREIGGLRVVRDVDAAAGRAIAVEAHGVAVEAEELEGLVPAERRDRMSSPIARSSQALSGPPPCSA